MRCLLALLLICGNKFDLNRWDPAYFKRLKDFVAQAGKRRIMVELNLFCPFYEESMWRLSPMNVMNNINGIGSVPRTDVYTLGQSGNLLAMPSGYDLRFKICELKCPVLSF